MNNKSTLFIARTAILLAIALLAQFFLLKFAAAGIFTTILTGTIINLVLYVATKVNNIWSGVLIGLITPIMAFIQGKLPVWFLIPIVGLSNAILVLVFGLIIFLLKKYKSIIAVSIATVSASVAKFVFMFVSILTYVPALFNVGTDFAPAKVDKLVKALAISWGYPQLVAALIGGILAYLLIKTIRIKSLNSDTIQ